MGGRFLEYGWNGIDTRRRMEAGWLVTCMMNYLCMGCIEIVPVFVATQTS